MKDGWNWPKYPRNVSLYGLVLLNGRSWIQEKSPVEKSPGGENPSIFVQVEKSPALVCHKWRKAQFFFIVTTIYIFFIFKYNTLRTIYFLVYKNRLQFRNWHIVLRVTQFTQQFKAILGEAFAITIAIRFRVFACVVAFMFWLQWGRKWIAIQIRDDFAFMLWLKTVDI